MVACLSSVSTLSVRVPVPRQGIAALASTSGVVAIDAENVRGKSGFRLSHDALLAAIAEWTYSNALQGRVVLVIDHGKQHQGFYSQRHGLGVVFAGPQQKADDVIARDVGYFSTVQRRDSIVVTADSGLRSRCRRKAHRARRLSLIQPTRFIESLFTQATEQTAAAEDSAAARMDGLGLDQARELAHIEERLQHIRSYSKRAKLLRQKESILGAIGAQHLAEPPPVAPEERRYLANLTMAETSALDAGVAALREAGLGACVGVKGRSGASGSRREKTWEREVLAEQLRQRLIEEEAIEAKITQDSSADALSPIGNDNDREARMALSDGSVGGSPVETYVNWLNAEVGSHGAPRAWLRTSTLAAGATRTVRLASESADVHVVSSDLGGPAGSGRNGNGVDGVRVIKLGRPKPEVAWPSADSAVDRAPPSPPLSQSPSPSVISSPPASLPVRIVVVSDTHGLERSLTPCEEAEDDRRESDRPEPTEKASRRLPEGDILIHCGDYQVDASARLRHEARR